MAELLAKQRNRDWKGVNTIKAGLVYTVCSSRRYEAIMSERFVVLE